ALALGGARLRAAAGGLAVPTPPHFDQNIGGALAPASVWRDNGGGRIRLGACLNGKPAVVVFGYYKCTQLCSVLERNVVDELRQVAPSVGRDYTFIYLDIDPTDGPMAARQQRAAAVRGYARGSSSTGWYYLTGNEDAIRAATQDAGFNYRYLPAIHQYQHPMGLLVVTPDDRISRYFIGMSFPPAQMVKALRRAALGKTGQPVLDVIIECCLGGEITGRYGPLIWTCLEVAVSATLIAVGGMIGWLLWEERRRRGMPS
ncbi:MAG: SCO family protein, partial [Opitutaceae bacterium]